jgi:hypothetical protein
LLSKCANPSCSASFRYLHEGKLFRIDVQVQPDLALAKGEGDSYRRTLPSRLEFFWLCDSCSNRMTVVYTSDRGVAVVPLRAVGNAS